MFHYKLKYMITIIYSFFFNKNPSIPLNTANAIFSSRRINAANKIIHCLLILRLCDSFAFFAPLLLIFHMVFNTGIPIFITRTRQAKTMINIGIQREIFVVINIPILETINPVSTTIGENPTNLDL